MVKFGGALQVSSARYMILSGKNQTIGELESVRGANVHMDPAILQYGAKMSAEQSTWKQARKYGYYYKNISLVRLDPCASQSGAALVFPHPHGIRGGRNGPRNIATSSSNFGCI